MPNREKDNSHVDEWNSMWEPDLEAIAYNGATCDPTKVDPKVLQWARENCVHKSHFIKVIPKTASRYGWHRRQGKSHGSVFQIGVPRPFVREHYKELGRVVTLENGIPHKKWKVSFSQPKKTSSWLQGWRKVADDNSLKPGDLMILVLVGHSHFRFHLVDKDGNIPGTNRKLQNNARVKIEPSDTYHSHQKYVLTDFDDKFKHKKLSRLFDPDLAIVKIEPRRFQRGASPEDVPPPYDHCKEAIIEPAQCDEPTVPGFMSSPDSELTVTNGDETIARGESARERKSAPNTRLCLIDSPQITDNNVDTLTEKGVSTARCAKTTSRQIDEGCEDGPVKWKLDFELTKTLKLVEGESCLVNNGITTQQNTSLQVQLRGTNANPPASLELLINPLNYFVDSKRRMAKPRERKGAWDVAKMYAESLDGYGFLEVMTEAKVYGDFHLSLPEQFVLDSSFPTIKTRSRLVDWDGSKSWEMYSMMNSCKEVAFHRKYRGMFSVEHFLEEGDVCVFQRIIKDTLTISVSIFRVLQLPKYLGRPGTVGDHYKLRLKS